MPTPVVANTSISSAKNDNFWDDFNSDPPGGAAGSGDAGWGDDDDDPFGNVGTVAPAQQDTAQASNAFDAAFGTPTPAANTNANPFMLGSGTTLQSAPAASTSNHFTATMTMPKKEERRNSGIARPGQAVKKDPKANVLTEDFDWDDLMK